ncbi:MAG TPA: thermonuclease family protein [Rhizomicrobium sp.]|nr:thermonuclease family protein [Rhizomicrobium sp.]
MIRPILATGAVAVVLLVCAPAWVLATPSCAGPAEISGAQLLRVERNGVVILTDGRALHMEGIRLPAGSAEHAPQAFADQAISAILALAHKSPLTLTAVPPKEDRYDRVRGQLFAGDGTWIQLALLQKGLARVAVAPDRTECSGELYAAEAQARTAHAGLWAAPAYAVRNPDTVRHDVGTFQIVEGSVRNTELRNGRAYLNFGADWRTDFTVTIDPEDMPNFRRLGVDPRAYAGQTIRVRGIVQFLNGPEIEAPNPQSIEVMR